MAKNALDEVKERLKHGFAAPSIEWDYLEKQLKSNDSERLSILKWVFSESPAFWDTRARAGLILLEENEQRTWSILKDLVDSADPDDNGTALTVFEITDDPRGLELAKRWLAEDIHPATQIEAVNFLKELYPDEVLERLQSLANDNTPNVRKVAKRLMRELDIS